QPGHGQCVRRGATGLLPQCIDLLQPRSAGPGRRSVPGRAVPQGLSGGRLEGVAAVHLARGVLHPARAQRPDLSAAGPAMTASTQPARRIDAVVIGASAGGIEALTVLLPALPAELTASLFVVLHLPR